MDVKTVFLNGNLLEDVYMTQPEIFVDPKNPNKVCNVSVSPSPNTLYLYHVETLIFILYIYEALFYPLFLCI